MPLMLDGSWFNAEGWAEVSHFLRLPLRAQVVRRCSLGARALLKFTGKHYWEFRGVPMLWESTDDQSYSPTFLNAPADCMVFGYFQSPRYFESITPVLRAELNALIGGAVQLPENLRTRLASSNSVAVHVRRKDYLNLPIFQVCDQAYYQQSMRQLRERLPAARFFIFSDDPAWCRAEFRDADQEVVDSGIAAANPLHELYLMSLASHHIIANSSYSWWAAWLGEKPDQRVMMPQRWYAHGITAPIEQKRMPHWEILSL
ncbi:MAG: alpha-1,2-fucosyltransferase [Verrucomicrobia bacterium]|nr:MAG: alpha-1,2-fucosyltransferase [Verrucomicrobiota bacterium]